MNEAAATKQQQITQDDLSHFIKNKLAVIGAECDLLAANLSDRYTRIERIKRAIQEIIEKLEK